MNSWDLVSLVLLAACSALAGLVWFFFERYRALSVETTKKTAEQKQQILKLSLQLEEAQDKIERQSIIDPLTDLVNRRGLERILSIEVNRAQRGGSPMVAMLLDCDNFKRINETLGHAVGDVALKEMVERITSTLRPSDYVARIGGDQFILLLTDTQFAEALLIAERVRLSVAESPIRHSKENIYVTASIGVALLPYEVSSVEEVMTLTRHALKQSKTAGKNRVSAIEIPIAKKNGDYSTTTGENADIVQILRAGDCFRCAKHPIMRLADEEQVGYELLSRGPHGPFEMPYDFFRIAIENNILTRVDLRCLKSCFHAATFLERGSRFDVNLFPSTILDTPIDRLVELFPDDKEMGTFCVEISEQQFIGDPSYLKEHTLALRKAGILVAIDDVGFGRSSLESLILLEPDVVKVDIKYVHGISMDKQKQRLLRRLIKVVDALGAELIAEGVESRDDMEMVREMGVKYAQGWLWGRPAEVIVPHATVETK